MVHRSIFKLSSGVSLLFVMICAGCVGYLPLNRADPSTRQNVTEEEMLSITPGQTSREEILLKLGEPDEISPDGTRLTYSWKRIKGTAWFFAGYGYGGGGGGWNIKKNYCLFITLDEKGIVRSKKIVEEEPLSRHYYTQKYSVSSANVKPLGNWEGRKINVGSFEAKEPEITEIRCGWLNSVLTPFGDPFSEYIREALIEELKRVDAFSENTPIILYGNLDRIDCNVYPGRWDISLTVRSSSGKSMNIKICHTFEMVSWEIFLENIPPGNLAADAFLPAVQKLINTMLESPEFQELVSN